LAGLARLFALHVYTEVSSMELLFIEGPSK